MATNRSGTMRAGEGVWPGIRTSSFNRSLLRSAAVEIIPRASKMGPKHVKWLLDGIPLLSLGTRA